MSDDTFVVVDKQVNNSWQSYKVSFATLKNFVNTSSQEYFVVHLDPFGGTIDGSSNIYDVRIPVGETVGNRLPTPIAASSSSGFAGITEFKGWWTKEYGEGVQILSDILVTSAGEITLYASWEGVIHYRNVGNVPIDSNGVATFGWSSSSGLQTVDKFDFGGNFRVVMKCQRGNGDGSFHTDRQDIFAGFPAEQESNNNLLMDFGLYGYYGYPQWEIAEYKDSTPTQNPDHSGMLIDQNQVFWLGVDVIKDGRENPVSGYYSWNGTNWTVDYNGPGSNYGIGGFWIGRDPDTTQSNSECWYGRVFLNECYLLQTNPNAANPRGKYVLRSETLA